MTMHRARGPLALGALLGPATKELRRRHGRLPAALLASWEEIAGPLLARRCRPLRYVAAKSGGTLHLAVDGPAALELQHLAPVLIERVNACLGAGAIARIKLRPGRVTPPPIVPRLAEAPRDPAAATGPADSDPLRAALDSLRVSLGRRAALKRE
jgi:hypothetical protein